MVKFGEFHRTENLELKYLGLRFDNVCNLSCRMCFPELSTGWYDEYDKLGRNRPQKIVNAFSDENLEKLLNHNLESVEQLYVAGGEPLISKGFIRTLERLLALGKNDVEIFINTNFSIDLEKEGRVIHLLSQFDQVYLDLSIDGVGHRGDFIRYPQKWSVVEHNISLILKKYPEIKVKAFTTVSIFNVFHLKDLITFLYEKFNFGVNDFRINPLVDPDYFDIRVLNKQTRSKGILELISLMSWVTGTFQKNESDILNIQLTGLINMLKEDLSIDPGKTLNEIEIIDKLRGQDFFKSCPEYNKDSFK